MHYSVPKMLVSLSSDTIAFEDTSDINNSSSGLSSTKNRPNSGLRSSLQKSLELSSAIDKVARKIQDKRNKTLEKLDSSPFMYGSSTTLDEFLSSTKKKETNNKGVLLESNWSLKAQAIDILSGKQQSNASRIQVKCYHTFFDNFTYQIKNFEIQAQQAKNVSMRSSKSKRISNEPQGPIDWSIRGLRSKYRGEAERENLWNSWLMANAHTDTAFEESGLGKQFATFININIFKLINISLFDFFFSVISLAKVERHPLYSLFFKLVQEENIRALSRTRSRLKMKRFVLDVQEVWLTNLQHLREHQPSMLLQDLKKIEENEAESGNGIIGRRDVVSLESMESQIQSVSQKRSMQRAFYTSAMPDVTVEMDYIPRSTPSLAPPRPLPPIIEHLLDGIERFATSDIEVEKSDNLCLIFIDRLLPPVDSLDRNILWRLSAIRKSNVLIGSFIAPEIQIAKFLKDALSNEHVSDALPPIYHLAFETNATIRWSVMNLNANVKMLLYKFPANSERIAVTVQLIVTEQGFENVVLTAGTTVIELLSVFKDVLEGNVEVENIDWWSSKATGRMWSKLIESLSIKDHEFNDEGDPFPKTLIINWARTVASSVAEALPTPKAYGMAYDILKYVKIHFKVQNETSENSDDEVENGNTVVDVNARLKASNNEELLLSLSFYEPLSNANVFLDGEICGRETIASAAVDIARLEAKRSSDKANDADSLTAEAIRRPWEEIADNVSNLSLRVSGGLDRVAQVPGACELGRLGIWFGYPHARERTQVIYT
jgi:hypothetical protein